MLHIRSVLGQQRQTDLLTEQGAEELALEDMDDSVQRLIQLVVLLPQSLSDATLVLVLVSVLELGPVLLQEGQGSLSIYDTNQQSTATFSLQTSPVVVEKLNKVTQKV